MDHKILILQDTIKRLLRRKAIPNLTKIINKTHPADIAQIFGNLTEYEYKNLFNLIKSPEVAADVLSELDSSIVANIVKSLENERLSEILQAMSSDDLADLLSSLPADLSERILLAIKKEDSEDVEELLQHPADTAGRIMNPNFFALREDTTVQDAISAVRKAADAEMVFYLYVVDERNHLVGVVSLRQLIIAPPYLTLKDIMIPDVISVTTDMDQEEVARIVEKYNILAVPVVDDKNHLVGIITVDDVIDVIRSEATEDIMKMAGTVEEEYSYLDNIFKASRFRLPWLITNLLGGLLTGYLMWLFKITLKEVLALVTFVPVITGMGGNVGTQSSSIVVRGIAIGKIDYSKTCFYTRVNTYYYIVLLRGHYFI